MYAIKYIIAGGLVLLVGFYVRRYMVRRVRRKKLLAESIRSEWKAILEKNIPLYNRMPARLQIQLEGLVNLFITEKRFEGCNGLEITDEIKVSIAGQACMLLLNRKTRYFPKLLTIYVYPSIFVAREVAQEGWSTGEPRQGESWQNGPVVLAWNSVTGGANNITDGRNVVFHEFSHRLDQEDGVADGAPILESRSCYATWAKVLGAEYAALKTKARKYRKSVVHRYGATDPAEFFAVATEAFFEKPKQMNKKHPDLYKELKNYYNLDPLQWS